MSYYSDVDDDDNNQQQSVINSDSAVQWTQCFDENYQTNYYYNSITGESVWEMPTDYKPIIDPKVNTSVSHITNHSSLDALPIVNQQYYSDVDDDIVYYSDMDENELKIANLAASNMHSLGGFQSRVYPEAVRFDNNKLKGGTSQDYIAMAHQYKAQEVYRDINAHPKCVLCHKNEAIDVFFPCQHRCVCRRCIITENICDDTKFDEIPNGYCNCSICAGIIKKILPFEGGKEVDKYWDWCYEINPPLPPGFARNFRLAGDALMTVYSSDPNYKSTIDKCHVS